MPSALPFEFSGANPPYGALTHFTGCLTGPFFKSLGKMGLLTGLRVKRGAAL